MLSQNTVALDEAHEILINRDMKAAVARPTNAYLQKTVHYLRYRIGAYTIYSNSYIQPDQVMMLHLYTTILVWEESAR